MSEEKIMKKLFEHDVHFEQVDQRFEQVDMRLDKMTNMLLNHEDRLKNIEENMATKQDIRGIHDTLDVIVRLLKKRDDENTFMSYRLQEHDTEIGKIKTAIGLT